MATTKEYCAFIMEQLSGLGETSCRAMMGEYVLYYRGKVVGGLYDNRLLVKPVPAAAALMDPPVYELPYEGGKPMLLVREVDDPAFLARLFTTLYPELPEPKPKKRKKPQGGTAE